MFLISCRDPSPGVQDGAHAGAVEPIVVVASRYLGS